MQVITSKWSVALVSIAIAIGVFVQFKAEDVSIASPKSEEVTEKREKPKGLLSGSTQSSTLAGESSQKPSTDLSAIYTGPTDTTDSFLASVRDTYFDNIENAKDGSGKSAFAVYKALNVCSALSVMVSGSGGVENYMHRTRQAGLDTSRVPLDDCREIRDALPEGSTFEDDATRWLSAADENAFGPAQLVNNWPNQDRSQAAYLKVTELLEDTIASGDPLVFQYVVKFYQQFHHQDGLDQNLSEVFKWEYLTCRSVSTCNSENLVAFWEEEFGLLEWEKQLLIDFPVVYQQHVENNTRFDFVNSWLPLHKHRAPGHGGEDFSEYLETN